MLSEGYVLLSIEYSSIKKLRYICPIGHISSMTYCNWRKGRRCPECKKDILSNMYKTSFDKIKKSFTLENYKLLSSENEYKNNRSKLRYECPNGHLHSISWDKWQRCQRCPTCYRENNIGPGHPNWKGGISCEPYCDVWLDIEFKNFIKERDGHMCLNPDCWHTTSRLSIHHVDYNKKNCNPNNLITLCISCNTRANRDREWHTDWYSAILSQRYNYTYKNRLIK